MVLITTVDDRMGMAFNRRRLSRDAAVIQDILEEANGSPIWMAEKSAKLFNDMPNIMAAERPWDNAGAGYCFVEFTDPAEFEGKVSRIILYRWNRAYPSDVKFGIDLNSGEWRLDESQFKEFEGTSHEKITKEVYKKC